MSEAGAPSTRRSRYRAEAIEEVKRIALEQLAESGAAGVSVNGIAKRMGVTGPALYRYFASRDDLLTALISDAYAELAEAIEESVRASARRRSIEHRFRDLAAAFRGWALAQPHRYQLLFGTPVPGYHAPPEMTDAAHRTMVALWQVLDELPARANLRTPALDRQIAAWAQRMWGETMWGDAVPTAPLRRTLLVWTRLHGLISTELSGHLTPMGIDPELLYQAEVEQIIATG